MTAPELTRLPADCTVDDIVEINERDGGAIVDGWPGRDLLKRFNAELEPLLDAHRGTDSGSEASDSFLGRNTRRLQGLTTKAPSFCRHNARRSNHRLRRGGARTDQPDDHLQRPTRDTRRPVENSYTNVPVELARGLPRKAQELLGYALYDASSIGGGYLGYHNMGDPMSLFD